MKIEWEEGFRIEARIERPDKEQEQIVLSANREGLLSLARILTALADEKPGCHIHLDAYNSLEDGSAELILERLE